MSTKITADNGVELEVCHLGIDATNPNPTEPSSIWARLTAEQRAKLAAALAPERAPIVEGRPVHGITVTGYVGDAPINPADCDRTTVYGGECRNFADTEWIRFDSGRRRSPDARDGNTWLIDIAYGSFWMADDKVRNLVPLVPVTVGGQWTRDDLPSEVLCSHMDHDSFLCDEMRDMIAEGLNALDPKPEHPMDPEAARLRRERDTAFRDADHYRQLRNEQFARAEQAEGQRDDAHTAYEKAARERDEAVARTEAMEKQAHDWAGMYKVASERAEKAERDRDEAYRVCNDRDDLYVDLGKAQDRIRELEQECENWRVTAINRAAPEVSRADVEKAIRAATHYIERRPDEAGFVLTRQDRAVDAVCHLFGVKAEQAVDPVEAKVTTRHPEHYRLVNEADGSEWRMNRAGKWLPADLLGQEASSDA